MKQGWLLFFTLATSSSVLLHPSHSFPIQSPSSTTPSSNNNNNQDAIFHQWCNELNILCHGARVRTTPSSVAGRGVFATRRLNEGEVIISIPEYAALTRTNGATYFPNLAEELRGVRSSASASSGGDNLQRKKKERRWKRLWNRLRRRKAEEKRLATTHQWNDDDDENEEEDILWQAELTAYALAASTSNHPWSTWIDQWTRNDPMQHLVDNNNTNHPSSSSWQNDDESSIDAAVAELHEMCPSISKYKLAAAVGIRLQQLKEYTERYGGSAVEGKGEGQETKLPTCHSMYTTLTSRAVALSNKITGLLPMHDMINHSSKPNLALAGFDASDESFKIVATRDIDEDEELFLEYLDVTEEENGGWDEDKATWLLVQWGIPSSPTFQTSPMEEEEVQVESEMVSVEKKKTETVVFNSS